MEQQLTFSSVYQYSADTWELIEIPIISEASITLSVNGEEWLSFLCTPTHVEALAVGFLFCEGVVESIEEVATVRLCPAGDHVDIWLNHQAQKPDRWRRTSGCTGGLTSAQSEVNGLPPGGNVLLISNQTDRWTFSPGQLCALVAQLYERQELYPQTGGVHTSVISDGDQILFAAEDIGRHNTIDKLAGMALMTRFSQAMRILMTTGRISSDMIQKAGRLGAQVVISRTSPTTASIRLADRWGITLVGYARRDRFRVYTHPQRLLDKVSATI